MGFESGPLLVMIRVHRLLGQALLRGLVRLGLIVMALVFSSDFSLVLNWYKADPNVQPEIFIRLAKSLWRMKV